MSRKQRCCPEVLLVKGLVAPVIVRKGPATFVADCKLNAELVQESTTPPGSGLTSKRVGVTTTGAVVRW